MDYRGLGSGIIRALKADANIEFRNEASGDQFRAILWRTEQKTTQETIHKTEGKEKGSEKTTQNAEGTEKSSEKSSEKGSEKTRDKILIEISKDSEITIAELANKLFISDRAVSKHLKRLQESGKIRRVGPDKGGHWEVCDCQTIILPLRFTILATLVSNRLTRVACFVMLTRIDPISTLFDTSVQL